MDVIYFLALIFVLSGTLRKLIKQGPEKPSRPFPAQGQAS